MSHPHRIVTLLLTLEEVDFILSAVDKMEQQSKVPHHRRLCAAIRGQIQQAKQRQRKPGESGPDTD